MTISILAAGSRGDTQPYIALGIGLKKAGYNVRIVTFENFEKDVTKHGLDFFPIKGDVSVVATSTKIGGSMSADNPIKFLFSFKKLRALVFDIQKYFLEGCKDSELIIYHPGASIGYFIAQKQNIPSIMASPFPMTPTKEYPALLFYNYPRLGKWYNMLTHRIFSRIMWFAAKGPIKKYWRKEFKKRPKNFGNPLFKQRTEFLPIITSCSSTVFTSVNDWSNYSFNTGYWFLDVDKSWEPSKKIIEFLGKGSPPVYIGFGSINDPKQAREAAEIIKEALKISGQRGIVATGWDGISESELDSENILVLKSIPHSWLFPQMSAVIHHGGAGTTAAGLKAGVPSIIIPFGNDQFAWGRRLFELGVSPNPIPRKKLTAEKLANAITESQKESIKKAAKEIGHKINLENGIENAVKIIINTLELKDRESS